MLCKKKVFNYGERLLFDSNKEPEFNYDEKSVIDDLIGDFIARGLVTNNTGLDYYQMLDLPKTASDKEIEERVGLTLDAIDAINALNKRGFSKANVIEQFNLASVQIRNAAEILGDKELRQKYYSKLTVLNKSRGFSQKENPSIFNRREYLMQFQVPKEIKEQVSLLNENTARFKFLEFSEDTKKTVGELFSDRAKDRNANFSLRTSSDDGKNLEVAKRLDLKKIYDVQKRGDATSGNEEKFHVEADDNLVIDFVNDTLARCSPFSNELGINAYQALDLSEKGTSENKIMERGRLTQDALRSIIKDLDKDNKLLPFLEFALSKITDSVNILTDPNKITLKKQLEKSLQKINETQIIFQQLEGFNSNVDNSMGQNIDKKSRISIEDLGKKFSLLSEESSDHDINSKTTLEREKSNQGKNPETDIQDLKKMFIALSEESSDHGEKLQNTRIMEKVDKVDTALKKVVTEKQNLGAKQKIPESLPNTMLSEVQAISIGESRSLHQRG